MSINGDIYNIDQSLTGNGVDDLILNSLYANYINNIPAQTVSYLDATSSIQTQLNQLTLEIGTGTQSWLFLGEFVFGTSYSIGNTVTYNNGTYVAIKSSNNQYPTVNTYWALICTNGATGANGTSGANGANGVTPDISIGTVITGSSGSSATVVVDASSTTANVILDFSIPQGEKGDKGDTGAAGDSTAATAGAVAAGVSAGLAAAAAAGAALSATAAEAASTAAEASAAAAETSAATAETAAEEAKNNTKYFTSTSVTEDAEICSAKLYVSDGTNNIHTFDISGNYTSTGSINSGGSITLGGSITENGTTDSLVTQGSSFISNNNSNGNRV